MTCHREGLHSKQFLRYLIRTPSRCFSQDQSSPRCASIGHPPLKNSLAPAVVFITKEARFIVTIDDLTSDENSVVIYDLLQNKNQSFRLADILTANCIDMLEVDHVLPGRRWSSQPLIDLAALKIFSSTPENALRLGLPFVEIDIRQATAKKTPVPLNQSDYFDKVESSYPSKTSHECAMKSHENPGIDERWVLPDICKRTRAPLAGRH
jgi:hypothetical protein